MGLLDRLLRNWRAQPRETTVPPASLGAESMAPETPHPASATPDIALRVIEENKRTRARFLDLGNCGLTDIPAEISEMHWLEGISFQDVLFSFDGKIWNKQATSNTGIFNDRIKSLARLASMRNLKQLFLSDTKIKDLSPLRELPLLEHLDISSTPAHDLRPLSNHKQLKSLNISHTHITDLASIAESTELLSLEFRQTKISNLLPLKSLTKLRWLDASDSDMSDLTPIGNLKNLVHLSLSSNKISDLTPLSSLNELEFLLLDGTPISELKPLSRLHRIKYLDLNATKIDSLHHLSSSTSLQVLTISNTEVKDLSPLRSLPGLTYLTASKTHITDLSPLSNTTELKSINIDDCNINDISALATLKKIESLQMKSTQVENLAPLAAMESLKMLNASNTRVSDLQPLRNIIEKGTPVKWEDPFFSNSGIFVFNCPLINPPPEIVEQGNESILNYFDERDAGDVDHLYEAKMLILGDGAAGKTTLLRRLYQPDQKMPSQDETTRGIAIHQHNFPLENGRRFRLNVWDFGGQEIYRATHQFFLTHRSLYILVDDTRNNHQSASDPGFKSWLDLIELFGDRSPVLIFQNEKGGRSKRINLAGLKGRYPNIQGSYAGDLSNPAAIASIRQAIEFHASNLPHIGEQLPARWLKVRSDVEARAREVPHIPLSEYLTIYGRHLEPERTKAMHLSRYLHDLGVFLHFQDDPLLVRTVILQNSWATEAVFKVLDDEVIKSRFGRFNGEDCRRLWHDSAYADMHPELLALMQNFELCYLLPDSSPQTWLAPQLLPPTKPELLEIWSRPEDLVLRFRYDVMPKGLISRLTVRLHRYVPDPTMAWTTGVLFERENTAVLVELLDNGAEIEMRARGPEHKALLSIVAAELDALNHSFEGLRDKIDKLIPCICGHCRAALVPKFFFQKDLLRRKERGRQYVECPESFENLNVIELLDGIRAKEPPRWVEEDKAAHSQRTIQIFLASSKELRDDRDAFELYVRQINDGFLKAGIYLKVVRWENFRDTLSKTRKQDDYNEAVRHSNIFVSLFFTKSGEYTIEEFDTAYKEFMASGAPRIYTYFKDAPIRTSEARKDDLNSLWAFQEKLSGLGHFWTHYENIPDLKLQFRDQLDKLLDEDGGLLSRRP